MSKYIKAALATPGVRPALAWDSLELIEPQNIRLHGDSFIQKGIILSGGYVIQENDREDTTFVETETRYFKPFRAVCGCGNVYNATPREILYSNGACINCYDKVVMRTLSSLLAD